MITQVHNDSLPISFHSSFFIVEKIMQDMYHVVESYTEFVEFSTIWK